MAETSSDSESFVELVQCRNLGSPAGPEVSTSSASSRESTPVAPLLLAIESPQLSALITALNATCTFSNIFSNNGFDIIEEIKYDPQWFRIMPSDGERLEHADKDWSQAVRVELQILNAFLHGNFERLTSSTGVLESLCRMKISHSEEPELALPSILNLLTSIPEIHNALMQSISVDSERVPALPLPVDAEGFSGSLSNILDRAFWPETPEFEDEAIQNISQIPILDPLGDVLLIQFRWAQVELDEEIWPERYTEKYRTTIQESLKARKDRETEIELLKHQISLKSEVNGVRMLDALPTALESLIDAGLNDAANELSLKIDAYKLELNKLMKDYESLELARSFSNSRDNLLSVDKSSLTPYTLKAVIWSDFAGDGPVAIIRHSESETGWLYLHRCEAFFLSWDDLLKFTNKTENFITIYEKKDVSKHHSLAPSIQKFLLSESENLASMNSTNYPESEDENSDQGPVETLRRPELETQAERDNSIAPSRSRPDSQAQQSHEKFDDVPSC